MKNKILSIDSINLLKEAHLKGATLQELINDPVKISKKLDLKVSKKIEKEFNALKRIQKERGEGINELISAEIISFFNHVMIDGRFVYEWVHHPERVAKILELDIPDETINQIKKLDLPSLIDIDPKIKEISLSLIGIGVVVTIVVLIVTSEDAEFKISPMIIDLSGGRKF